MKKNKMMRLASALLVAVLLTTCGISGTFAKYVSNQTGTDHARVAKWGVEVEAEALKLFDVNYKTDDKSLGYTGEFSVVSDNGTDKVLAPGTSGTFADIKIKGTPEVAVDVDVVGTVALTGSWQVDGDFYCPIVVTVGTESVKGLDFDNATDFANAIKAKIDGKSATYEPNKDLSEFYDTTNLDLSWNWAFEEGLQGTKNNQTNAADTKLGRLAVAENLDIAITVAITVTQIN